MAVTKAAMKAQAKYDKENTKSFMMKLNTKYEHQLRIEQIQFHPLGTFH